MSDFPAEMVTPGDGPIDLPPVKPGVAQVFACVDCSGLDRVDPTKLRAFTSDPCGCGCGWYTLHCQICGRKIGEGTSAGTIDLSADSGHGKTHGNVNKPRTATDMSHLVPTMRHGVEKNGGML